MPLIKYCSDLSLSVVTSTFENKGWQVVDSKEEWNIYWAHHSTIKTYFSRTDIDYRLNDNQFINHFPNYCELSRKDMLFKNISDYREKLENEGSPLAKKDEDGNYIYLGFIPLTFAIPKNYKAFEEAFKQEPKSVWIVKPSGKSEGIGIFLISKLSELKRWAIANRSESTHLNHIVSRYIENPLLIGGKKFDLRIYVLVLAFNPLIAYRYKLGFCRFCQLKYSKDSRELNNTYVHLTNITIQRQGNEYNTIHGGKWTIQNLRLFLEGTRGIEATAEIFTNINALIVHSLKAVAPLMGQDPHCFECYGYDIIISDDFKPWLIEVNASPSLVTTTENDRIMKQSLIEDIFTIMCPGNRVPDIKRLRVPDERHIGRFELLCNEREKKSCAKHD